MKLTLKLILVVCLFSSITLAEDGGTMTGGGKSCPQGQTSCRPADTGTTDDETILIIIQKYLISIFG